MAYPVARPPSSDPISGSRLPLSRRSCGSPASVRAGILLLVLQTALITQVKADAYDTFNFVPSLTRMHDDNLFRLSANANTASVLGKPTRADDITVSTLAFKVNKPYAQQRFELEYSLTDFSYHTYDYLSYQAQPYKAAWRWNLTPYLHGNLTADSNTFLYGFADYTGYTKRNMHTDENRRFDGVLDITPSWHLLGGVAQSTAKNTQQTQGQGDFRIDAAETGLRYTAPSGSTLSYVLRNGKGEYVNRPYPIPSGLIDNHFDDRENEFRMLWLVTAKTSVDTRLSHIQRTHANYAARDYGGMIGNLNFNWNVTAKSSLTASMARELSSFQTAFSSYTSTDRFTVQPSWQLSANTALRGKYDYARRDYLGAIADTPSNNRSDILRTTMISLEWQSLRNMIIVGSLQNDTRSSNINGLDFKSKSVTLTAQITF